ncbi:MAG: hypothetical protein HPY73_07670 [Methanomassiliicoccales archaeon]|nr:MAG: hypothetical protein HPY73_07670 [Methanomassiliicoccales archaeon]
MKFDDIPFMPKEAGAPWLPASVADARKFAYYGVVAALIILVVEIVFLLFSLFGGPGLFLYSGASGFIIGILIVVLSKPTLFDPLDQGKFKDANIMFLIWGILGLIVMIVPGILILIGFVRLQDVFSPQYQQYKPQQGQVAKEQQNQPAQEQQPPAPPQQEMPAASEEQTAKQGSPKVEMVKCKKCGVQYPAFMHHCPNCNEPR